MNKILPVDITSRDILKTLLILLIIADHIGAFFLPQYPELRLCGRLAVPAWFFLIGFSRSRDTGVAMWFWGLAVLAATLCAGQTLLPLGVLFTMIVVRLLLDSVLSFMDRSIVFFALGTAGMFMAAYPSYVLFDYGAFGLMFAVFGAYAFRTAESGARLPARVWMLAVLNAMVYAAAQIVIFRFDDILSAFLVLSCFALVFALASFRMDTLSLLTRRLPSFVAAMIKFTGRRTLEIYAVHLVVFYALGMIYYPLAFPLLGWRLSFFPLPF